MENKENRLLTSELLEALASYPLYTQEHKHLPGVLLTVEQAKDFQPCRLADIADEDVQQYCSRFTPSD